MTPRVMKRKTKWSEQSEKGYTPQLLQEDTYSWYPRVLGDRKENVDCAYECVYVSTQKAISL